MHQMEHMSSRKHVEMRIESRKWTEKSIGPMGGKTYLPEVTECAEPVVCVQRISEHSGKELQAKTAAAGGDRLHQLTAATIDGNRRHAVSTALEAETAVLCPNSARARVSNAFEAVRSQG